MRAGYTTSVSTINLDAIQPLLRGGGKAVTLEPLTQVERLVSSRTGLSWSSSASSMPQASRT